jgi:uncharacterized RDD family membrane protein YckC
MTAAELQPQPQLPDLAAYRGRYAGFVSRVASGAIDIVLCAALSTGMVIFVQALLSVINSEPMGNVAVDPEIISWMIFGIVLLYFTLSWAIFQRTLGETLFGLRVQRNNGKRMHLGRAFLRFVISFLSLALIGLGYLWILFDPKRRTWQDIVARTVVLYDFGDEP